MRSYGRLWSVITLAMLLSAGSCRSVTAADPITLQVALWINDAKEVDPTIALMKEYEQANPGVKIEVYQQAFGGYHQKILTMAAAGLTPDVLVLNRDQVPSFADQGIIQPIDKWVAQEKNDPRKLAVEIKSGLFDGKLYGFPLFGGPNVYAYNATMFSEAGVQSPVAMFRSGMWTWDNAVSIGKKVTRDLDGNGVVDQYMFPAISNFRPDWVPKVMTYGGGVMNADQTDTLIDTPESIKGLQMFVDIAHVHHVAPRPGEMATGFEQGGTATSYQWVSETPNLAKRVAAKFEVDLVPMPAGPAGQFHIAGGAPMCISSITKHPDEAYKFALWYSMYSNSWQLRGIPANMNTVRREYRTYLSQFFKNPDAVSDAMLGTTDLEPGIGRHYNDIYNAYSSNVTRMSQGKISVQEGVSEIARLIRAALKK